MAKGRVMGARTRVGGEMKNYWLTYSGNDTGDILYSGTSYAGTDCRGEKQGGPEMGEQTP